jgi:hypothetical protein
LKEGAICERVWVCVRASIAMPGICFFARVKSISTSRKRGELRRKDRAFFIDEEFPAGQTAN